VAALLVRAVLDRGLVLEIYEGGECRLIDSQGKQEIKLTAGAGLDLLAALERSRDILEQAVSRNLREMEETYGPAAPHAEHSRGESITYRIEDLERSGTIIWVAAARNVAGIDLPLHYVVAPDVDAGLPDLVFPGDVIEQG